MNESLKATGVALGETIEGKYRLDAVLGEGGMGVVLRAFHERLREPVAIKLLHPDAGRHPELIARFEREARIAAKLKSEHAVRTIDIGELSSGAPFIVMEFMEGEDLDQRLDRGPLSVTDAIDLVLEAAEALAEAHDLGVVHRDLKPANLFLARRRNGKEVLKILDFGISKLQEADELDLTQTAALMGSPLYMSPEQMRNARDVDHRTDIWSLGVILYRTLTGAFPFHAETLTELAIVVTERAPAPLSDLRSEISPELGDVVLRCLAKGREERPQSVVELVQLLSPFASEDGKRKATDIARTPSVGAPRSATTDPQSSTVAPLSVTSSSKFAVTDGTLTVPTNKPSRLWWFALGLLGILGVGGLTLPSPSPSPSEQATESTTDRTSKGTAQARTSEPSTPAFSAEASQEVATPPDEKGPEPETNEPSDLSEGSEVKVDPSSSVEPPNETPTDNRKVRRLQQPVTRNPASHPPQRRSNDASSASATPNPYARP